MRNMTQETQNKTRNKGRNNNRIIHPSNHGLIFITAVICPPPVSDGQTNGTNRPYRFIYNTDGDNMFIHSESPVVPGDVYARVDEIADTGVTTLFVCPNVGMNMNYPSHVADMLGADSQQGDESNRLIINLHALLGRGHDPLGLIISHAQDRGLEVFITFRLNEVHAVDQPDSILLSRFWRDHPEWHIGIPGDDVGDIHLEILGPRVNPIVAKWLPGGLNFSIPEVRDRRLAELKEVCERYPIDGLDLDFQRFPIYFPFGSETSNIGTMTSWVREVREMTKEIADDRDGHILLSARIMARPEQNLGLGLDPAGWAEEELVDFLIISHYLRNDFPLPVAEHREILPTGMPIYASIEVEHNQEEYRRIARKLWEKGVDGVMLFNFFTWREGGREPPFELLDELGDTTRLIRESDDMIHGQGD